MNATDARLEVVRSHTVSLDHRGGQVTKEECYPRVQLTWRGQPVTVELSADRFVTSSDAGPRWTDWRIYTRNAETDAQRRAFNEAAVPLVQSWLDSDEYLVSRQSAFKWMIKNELRDANSTYNVQWADETLDRYAHELSQEDRARLATAIVHLRQFYDLIEN